MTDVELKQTYKEVKRQAMALFDKSAVGEVKDEFYGHLKKQMGDKYELFRLENEKTSD